jgi:hypothetical protein
MVWIIELVIAAIIMNLDNQYSATRILDAHGMKFLDIAIILALALPRRILNALFLCFICFKKYSISLKVYIVGFYMFFYFAVIIMIISAKQFSVFADLFLSALMLIFFVMILFHFVFFGFVLMKIKKEQADPNNAEFPAECKYFIANSFFVFIGLPIYSLVETVFLLVDSSIK